jgi:HD-GYP domain-containing protein (c-di-GMP phosphodiesterase class II)
LTPVRHRVNLPLPNRNFRLFADTIMSSVFVKELEFKELEQRVRDVTSSTLSALVQLLDLKDLTTGLHSSRLVTWVLTISKLVGLSPEETRQVEIAGVLHDLGKIGIPDAILKKPSKLTPEEQKIMRRHSEFGWAVMKNIPGCETASLLILHHHEMWNGEGYPTGLKGENIPLGARIVAVTDAFDAMTSDRCYRKATSPEYALATLERYAGKQFDPQLVALFAEYIRQDRVYRRA